MKAKFYKLYVAYQGLIPLFVTINGIVFSLILEKRAFLIGFIVALLFCLRFIYKQRLNKYLISFAVFSISILFFLIAFYFKTDSSLGRVLIYKISFQMFKDHWLYGIGLGNFKVSYLNYQAAYFASGNNTKNELLLADNTYYAFNDYWQFIIETGLLGMLFLSIAVFLLFTLVKKLNVTKSHTLKVALIVLIVLSTAAFFTHIFEKIYYQSAFLTATTILLISFSQKNTKIFIKVACIISLISLLFIHYGKYMMHYKAYQQFFEALDLSGYGYQNKAITTYQEVYPQLKHDDDFLEVYANAFFKNDEYKNALRLYQLLIHKKNSNLLNLSIANCYQQQDNPLAEIYFIKAVNMVPNRFIPRESLFNYYILTKQKAKALETGQEILRLPVKVPSKRIKYIKENVKNLLFNSNSIKD